MGGTGNRRGHRACRGGCPGVVAVGAQGRSRSGCGTAGESMGAIDRCARSAQNEQKGDRDRYRSRWTVHRPPTGLFPAMRTPRVPYTLYLVTINVGRGLVPGKRREPRGPRRSGHSSAWDAPGGVSPNGQGRSDLNPRQRLERPLSLTTRLRERRRSVAGRGFQPFERFCLASPRRLHRKFSGGRLQRRLTGWAGELSGSTTTAVP